MEGSQSPVSVAIEKYEEQHFWARALHQAWCKIVLIGLAYSIWSMPLQIESKIYSTYAQVHAHLTYLNSLASSAHWYHRLQAYQ